MFFTLSKNITKQLKLRDIYEGLAPMHKLASKRKVCLMHKIINLSFIPGYVPIYKQRCRVKLELGLLLPLKLGVSDV
jgi:hypothetical protein